MPELSNKAELQRYADDAHAKLEALKDREEKTSDGGMAIVPGRVTLESQTAADEGRKPFPIVPLTEVEPAVLGPFLATLTVPSELSESHKTLSRVCRQQKVPFAMRSDQLLGLLALAGIEAKKE